MKGALSNQTTGGLCHIDESRTQGLPQVEDHVDQSCGAPQDLIFISSDSEDEATVTFDEREIDLTSSSPGGVSTSEEGGRELTTPLELKASKRKREAAAQRRRGMSGFSSRPKKRMEDFIDLTLKHRSSVLGSKQVVDLTSLPADLELDLTSMKVAVEIDLTSPCKELKVCTTAGETEKLTSSNENLPCPVCLDPLFELEDGR